jgi:hypothetical protein
MTKQLLHLVFGGRVTDISSRTFENTEALDIVGMYPSYTEAYKAWRGKSQAMIDDAEVRYFIVHLHRLFDPSTDEHPVPLDKVFDITKGRRVNLASGPESSAVEKTATGQIG